MTKIKQISEESFLTALQNNTVKNKYIHSIFDMLLWLDQNTKYPFLFQECNIVLDHIPWLGDMFMNGITGTVGKLLKTFQEGKHLVVDSSLGRKNNVILVEVIEYDPVESITWGRYDYQVCIKGINEDQWIAMTPLHLLTLNQNN